MNRIAADGKVALPPGDGPLKVGRFDWAKQAVRESAERDRAWVERELGDVPVRVTQFAGPIGQTPRTDTGD